MKLSPAQRRLIGMFTIVFARNDGRDWITLQPNDVRTARALESRGLVTVAEVPVLNLMGTRAVITDAGRAFVAGLSR